MGDVDDSAQAQRRHSLITLGMVIATVAVSGLALNDLVLYERQSPQAYCRVTRESATEREGGGTAGEWIADTGSGCWMGEARVCEYGRLILEDKFREC